VPRRPYLVDEEISVPSHRTSEVTQCHDRHSYHPVPDAIRDAPIRSRRDVLCETCREIVGCRLYMLANKTGTSYLLKIGQTTEKERLARAICLRKHKNGGIYRGATDSRSRRSHTSRHVGLAWHSGCAHSILVIPGFPNRGSKPSACFDERVLFHESKAHARP